MRSSVAVLLLFLLPACSVLPVDAQVLEVEPNIVIIMADDMGYRDASCYGCIDFETPHIDALAAAGVRCTNGYVSHPYCSPSRAGLMSGRYQQSFGHEHNPGYRENDHDLGIDTNTRLLPDVLSDAGYTTGLVGKWHLGAGPPFRPVVRGFTEFYGFLGGGHHYFEIDPASSPNYGSPMWRDHGPTDDTLTYLTDDLTAEAEAFIDRNQGEPFCLLVMYNAPHAPDHVTDEYMAMVADISHMGRRKYAALVRGVDAGVGRVIAKLEEHGLTENTLVVFLSDNGGRGGVSDNRPLRGNKGWLHEGGLRVPFILSMPGKLPTNTVYEKPIIALDLLPTAIAIAGIEAPAGLDGINIFPYLTGEADGLPHETLYWRTSGGDGIALRHGDWKLVRDIGMDTPMLYNLAEDIGEDNDLSGDETDTLAALLAIHAEWVETLETPRWTENHTANVQRERRGAEQAGTRQIPMPWVDE